MKSLRGRRMLPVCVAAFASAAALASPGAASAVTTNQCSGANVTGQGASVMKIALGSVLDGDFNTSSNKTACSGSQGSKAKPTVTYASSSSGLGLESWGVNKHAASFGIANAFVATEEPPNTAQKEEIESHESTSTPSTLQTIPVLQEAVTILVNLPSGCTATSTPDPGRLVLNNTTLEGIFRGTITTWSQIDESGDALSGASCNADTPITKVVRLDSAGTTHILKKYLNLINATPFEAEGGSSDTWNQVSEGTANTVWPTADAVVRPLKTGDSAEISKIAETPGSIGYASLADSRANADFYPSKGGAGTATFWVPIQNSGTTTKKPTYTDPSTNGEVETPAEANCAKEKYTNGSGTKFPPSSTSDSWSEVTTATKQTNYTLCGFAYELALSKYSLYPETSEAEAITVENFLLFELEDKAGGGQELILNHDYEPIPKSLVKEADTGAKAVAY
jgi:ABC-type phosphate transport system substrate-binding protein